MNIFLKSSIFNITLSLLFMTQLNAMETPQPPSDPSSIEGVQGVKKMSPLRKLISNKTIDDQAQQQYQQLLKDAAAKKTLFPADNPQLIRIKAITQKIIPYTHRWNEYASKWTWEINVIQSKQVNAFCMPGGKIVIYTGLLDELALNDHEAAMVIGHEIAHALREHGRERVGKAAATQGLLSVGSHLLGLGDTGRTLANTGANLLSLKFGRDDETESDIVGLDIASRAGYDPRSGISLWQKMGALNKNAPPQWLSTHPSGNNRIAEIQQQLPKVLPLYAKTQGLTVKTLPAYPPSTIK